MNISLQVKKRDGKLESYQVNKLRLFFQKITCGRISSNVQDLIISKIEKQIFNYITTIQISEILILTTTSLIEKDPLFDKLAAQLLLQKIHRQVFKKKTNY